jgi:hypothetical protein
VRVVQKMLREGEEKEKEISGIRRKEFCKMHRD